VTTANDAALIGALAEHLVTRRPLGHRLALVRDELTQACPEASGLAALVAGLFDPNFDPTWLRRLWPCTCRMITAVSDALGASATSRRCLRRDLTRIGAAVNRLQEPRRALLHLVSPVAAFHWSMWICAHRGEAPLYQVLAPLIHARMRVLEHTMLARSGEFGAKLDRNLYDHLRSARLLCFYGTPSASMSRDSQSLSFAADGRAVAPASAGELIEEAAERWMRSERKPPAPRTVAKRKAHLEILLALRDHEILPHSTPVRTSAMFVPRLRVLRLHDCAGDPEAEVAESVVLIDPPPAAAKEGELPVDYGRLIEDPSPDVSLSNASVRGPLRLGVAERVAMARLGLIHDASTAQLFEFADVYASIFDRPVELMDGAQLRAALFGGLQMLYGLSPTMLGTVRLTAGQPPSESGPWLDLEEGTLWLPLPSVAYAGRIGSKLAPVCRPGSNWASIPLLPWLRRIAGRYQSVRHISRGGLVFMDGEAPNGHHDLSASSGAIAVRHSGQRLARSATRWLLHRGLEPIFAAILSARFNFSTLAAAAYANLSDTQLAEAHARSAARVHLEILAECRDRGRRLAHLEDPDLVCAPPRESRRFGSRIAPRLDALTAAVDALESRRRLVRVDAPLREMIDAFNLAMVYAWLRLSWATGLRPRRDPAVRRGRWDTDLGWLFIEDKDSPFGVETRVVPLADGEGPRLAHLQELGDRVRWRLRATSRVALHGLPDDCLFFAVLGGHAAPLSPEAVRSVLEAAGLADRFPWPLNAPRHYWITRALEHGIPLTELDAFLGHLHGPLPWGVYASRPLGDSGASFRRFGAAILKEVGFRDTS
jgi:hypothetical protein